MDILDHRRLIAGIFAVCSGLLAPIISGFIVVRGFGHGGIDIYYGSLPLAIIGVGISVWISDQYSWKYVLLYGLLAMVSTLTRYYYTLSQMQA